jgi:hypothetical protein
VAKPKPLTIVHEHVHRRPLAIAEHEHRAGERILLECSLAESSQAIDPSAEICWLDGDQDLHLWRDLQHHSVFQKPRERTSTSAAS